MLDRPPAPTAPRGFTLLAAGPAESARPTLATQGRPLRGAGRPAHAGSPPPYLLNLSLLC
jgi:hypothetical protein